MKFLVELFKNIPVKERRLTLSTKITILRILTIPVIFFSIISHQWNLAFWLIVFAAISDIVDGILARLRNEKTLLGACLDPISDKFLVLSCYLALAFHKSHFFYIPDWFIFFAFFKEIILLLGAAVFYSKGLVQIKPNFWGKAAMVVQTAYIIFLITCYNFNWHSYKIYNILLSIVILFIFASLYHYAKVVIKQLMFQQFIQR